MKLPVNRDLSAAFVELIGHVIDDRLSTVHADAVEALETAGPDADRKALAEAIVTAGCDWVGQTQRCTLAVALAIAPFLPGEPEPMPLDHIVPVRPVPEPGPADEPPTAA